MRTLVVEDDLTERTLLTEFLKAFGQCDYACDGVEAVKIFRRALAVREYYDLICLDIMMPEMDGLAVLTAIRKLEKENNIPATGAAKIIVITGLTDRKIFFEAMRGKCDAYIRKPVKLDEFLAELKGMNLVK